MLLDVPTNISFLSSNLRSHCKDFLCQNMGLFISSKNYELVSVAKHLLLLQMVMLGQNYSLSYFYTLKYTLTRAYKLEINHKCNSNAVVVQFRREL